MPLIKSLEQQRFSERGPVPRPLNVGDGLAVMLLCLQGDQSIVAPAGDGAETVFTVLGGSGAIREGEEEHEVAVGDVVFDLDAVIGEARNGQEDHTEPFSLNHYTAFF